MTRILFVCTGNTCRSPMAEALARAEAQRRGVGGIEVRSAGTFAVDGQPASAPAVRVGRRHGLDLGSHRSRPLNPDHVAWADVVVGMTPAHLDAVLFLRPISRAALATEFLPPADPRRGSPVPDPFGATEEDYERTLDMLADCVRALLDTLIRDGGRDSDSERGPAR